MFRFTIRDLLWLMVVVAVVLIWLIERRRYTAPTVWRERAEAAAEVLQDEGYQTSWSRDSVIFQTPSGRSVGYPTPGYPDGDEKPRRSPN
jgi:lysylphosphatidylglycerol synthetase-like protein (DUF2156 family)